MAAASFVASPSFAGQLCDPASIDEVFIDVVHAYLNGEEVGYAVDLGIEQSEFDAVIISGVSVTPPVGGRALLALSGSNGNYDEFDGNTFDPDTWTGTGYTQQALQALYPNGIYTFAITDSCTTTMVDVTHSFLTPNGTVRTLFPTPSGTINSGRPVVVTSNTCTDCNTLETSIYDAAETVVLTYEPESVELGSRPNAVTFADFFGPDGEGNEGSGGDISASGLPAGSYSLVSALGESVEILVESCGNGVCFFYNSSFEVDLTTFTVGADTVTSADLDELDIELFQLSSRPSELPFELGFYVETELRGTDLVDATLYVPNSFTLSLNDDGDGRFAWLSDAYSTRSGVLADFPATDGASKYVLIVDGGRAAAALDFVPVEPNGKMTLTTLKDQDTISATATVDLTNTCTNCSLISLWLEDVATGGDSVSGEAEQFDFEDPSVAGPLSFTVPDDFDSLTEPLPDGDYFMGTESINESFFGEVWRGHHSS